MSIASTDSAAKDYLTRDESGASPLGKLLGPKPDWRRLTAFLNANPATIHDVLDAVAERSPDAAARNQNLAAILAADLAENNGRFADRLLSHADADRVGRQETARIFFDVVYAATGGTLLYPLIESAGDGTFAKAVALLADTTADNIMAIDPDEPIAKLYQQVLLCRRLLRDDGQGRGLLFAALEAGRSARLKPLLALLADVDLEVRTKKGAAVEAQNVTVDPQSPAPHNPLLSLLLRRDGLGNTVLHLALLKRDQEAFEALVGRLLPQDALAIMTRVPNNAGLLVTDYVDRHALKTKLSALVEAGMYDRVESVELYERVRGADKALVDSVKAVENRCRKRLQGKPTKVRFDIAHCEAVAARPPDLTER